MRLFDRFKAISALARLSEETLYAQVVKELEAGIRRDGIWAKALIDSNGDQDKAKTLYVRYRVQSLKDEDALQREVETSEQEIRSSREDARAKRVAASISFLRSNGYHVGDQVDGGWHIYSKTVPVTRVCVAKNLEDLESFVDILKASIV